MQADTATATMASPAMAMACRPASIPLLWVRVEAMATATMASPATDTVYHLLLLLLREVMATVMADSHAITVTATRGMATRTTTLRTHMASKRGMATRTAVVRVTAMAMAVLLLRLLLLLLLEVEEVEAFSADSLVVALPLLPVLPVLLALVLALVLAQVQVVRAATALRRRPLWTRHTLPTS